MTRVLLWRLGAFLGLRCISCYALVSRTRYCGRCQLANREAHAIYHDTRKPA